MAENIETLRRLVVEALDGVELHGQSENELREVLNKKLPQHDLISNIGWIVHACTVWNNDFQVQFNISGDGWSSRWPSWAYKAARDALLHNKKLWIISRGLPYGQNILLALVTNKST
jgi:hypothetical protein